MSQNFLQPYTFPRTKQISKNRLWLASMTNKQSHADGTLSDDEYDWLIRRAQGGFGVITTCAVHVSKDGQGWEGELGAFGDEHIPGLSRLASGLHEHGSLGLAQIFHGGCRAPSKLTGTRPISASEFSIETPDWEVPRAATTDDINRIIQDFAAAARRCADAGFDGIEIHGAHGYIITQFISTQSNQRKDEWGGSLENRARFLRAIYSEIKKVVPDDFIVGVRLSPENLGQQTGLDIDENLQIAKWLESDGVDFIHISNWELFKKSEKHPDDPRTVCEMFRNALAKDFPLIICGGFSKQDDVKTAMDQGADFVAMARCAIGNPDWPTLATNQSYVAEDPPFSASVLAERGLGPVMIDYMSKWQGFVKD
jgi:2,4-dienoyl-CoA reductase-like NADH-dependent reductase (Old Yellow Enzyme family)